MKIRPIEPNDLVDIVSLIQEFAEFENLTSYCVVDENKLEAAMFGEHAIVEGFVAIDNDDVMTGYALYYPGFSSFRGELGLNLEDLYVRESSRGLGVGRMLLKEVAKAARQRGLVRLDLMVNIENPGANAFYKSLGAKSNPNERHFKFSDQAFIELAR